MEALPALVRRVAWPNGRAARAEVCAEGLSPGATERIVRECDDEGRFELDGLGLGPFVISASAWRRKGPDGVLDDGIAFVRCHRAIVDPVHAERSAVELALVLHADAALAGVVVDERGEPWRSFTIAAESLDAAGARELPRTVSETFSSLDGSFELRGLTRGQWNVFAARDGTRFGEQRVAATESDGASLRFVLPRGARLRGRVLGVDGGPIAGAVVQLFGDPSLCAVVKAVQRDWARSDVEGRFQFDEVEPPNARLLLLASIAGGNVSSPLVAADVGRLGEGEVDLIVPPVAMLTVRTVGPRSTRHMPREVHWARVDEELDRDTRRALSRAARRALDRSREGWVRTEGRPGGDDLAESTDEVDLAPGRYRLRARGIAQVSATVEVDVDIGPNSAVTLRLLDGLRIDARVGANSAPAMEVHAADSSDLTRESLWHEWGDGELLLPPDTYRIVGRDVHRRPCSAFVSLPRVLSTGRVVVELTLDL